MLEFSYKNNTSSMVIFKCIGINTFFVEKVIFPQEVFTLLAPEDSHVEIWGIQSFGPTLEKRMRVSKSDSLFSMAA